MNFSVSLDTLKMGNRVKLECWDDIEYIFLVPKYSELMGDMNAFKLKYPFEFTVKMHQYIAALQTDGSVVSWNPTQIDLLSNDWIEP